MPSALLDTSVVVAIAAEEHGGHVSSLALLAEADQQHYAVAAHSFAEAYSTLTRRNASSQFRWSPEDAWASLKSVAAATTLVGLTPAQTFQAIGEYVAAGGIGSRLYDRLIGQVALQYGLPRIITWNVGHMRGLFPKLDVIDPSDAV